MFVITKLLCYVTVWKHHWKKVRCITWFKRIDTSNNFQCPQYFSKNTSSLVMKFFIEGSCKFATHWLVVGLSGCLSNLELVQLLSYLLLFVFPKLRYTMMTIFILLLQKSPRTFSNVQNIFEQTQGFFKNKSWYFKIQELFKFLKDLSRPMRTMLHFIGLRWRKIPGIKYWFGLSVKVTDVQRMKPW